jgi:hypothetical protein
MHSSAGFHGAVDLDCLEGFPPTARYHWSDLSVRSSVAIPAWVHKGMARVLLS